MRDTALPQAQTAVHGRVLLVEDEPIVLEVCTRLLRQAGFVVEPIHDFDGVDAALRRKPFDVVIAGLRVGSLTGLDVWNTVHSIDPDVQVVLMSGDGDLTSALVQAVEHGALRCLTKPVSASTLLGVAENAVALKQLASARRRRRTNDFELALAAVPVKAS
jgi:two-component system C4-dicarboxylate transport response regulator DctD